MELEEWRKVLDTNLLSAFLICREVIPLMAAEGGGRVVAITSGLGSTGVARGAHYAASKAGLDALMRSLAEEVVEQGINVNCIAPGITDTPMMRRANRPEDVTAITERLPRRRLGAPQDMVPLVLFLVGVGAEHITGQVYSLRGTVR
jgi:NAD(P)-dependent dehydrogenase (short-subunit alcohol dehydrogenase family)